MNGYLSVFKGGGGGSLGVAAAASRGGKMGGAKT